MQAAHARPMAAFWLLAAAAVAISGLGVHGARAGSGPNVHEATPTQATSPTPARPPGTLPGELLLPVATGGPAPRVAALTDATPRVVEVVGTTTRMTVSAAKSATSSGRPRSGSTKLSSTSTRDADTTLSRPRHGHAKGHGVVATASTAPGRSGVAHADHGVGHGH